MNMSTNSCNFKSKCKKSANIKRHLVYKIGFLNEVRLNVTYWCCY